LTPAAVPVVQSLLAATAYIEGFGCLGFAQERLHLATFDARCKVGGAECVGALPARINRCLQHCRLTHSRAAFFKTGDSIRQFPGICGVMNELPPATAALFRRLEGKLQATQLAERGFESETALLFFEKAQLEQPPQPA
jgi:hypothetical protein